MPSIPIMCLICSKSIKDSMFPQHMSSVHGGLSQGQALAAEKNIPTQQSPIILDKDTPPSDSFMEVAQMLDKKPEPKKDPPVPSIVADTSMGKLEQEVKPLELRYQWDGNCPKCNTPVKTITLKAKGQTVCVAYCLTHNEIKQREVADLEEIPQPGDIKIFDNHEEHVALQVETTNRKEVKKHDKRQSKFRNNASVSAKMLAPGLPSGNKPSISS